MKVYKLGYEANANKTTKMLKNMTGSRQNAQDYREGAIFYINTAFK